MDGILVPNKVTPSILASLPTKLLNAAPIYTPDLRAGGEGGGGEGGGRGQCDCWVWYLKFNSKSTPRNLDNHPQFGAIYAWLPLLVKFRTASSFLRETFAERCEYNGQRQMHIRVYGGFCVYYPTI